VAGLNWYARYVFESSASTPAGESLLTRRGGRILTTPLERDVGSFAQP
jgi:hypothetical protein